MAKRTLVLWKWYEHIGSPADLMLALQGTGANNKTSSLGHSVSWHYLVLTQDSRNISLGKLRKRHLYIQLYKVIFVWITVFLFTHQILMNASTKTFTTVQMSSTSVSTFAALTSVNANKICILLMANAEVISSRRSIVTGRLSLRWCLLLSPVYSLWPITLP